MERFEIPPKPEPPKLGRKPRALKKQEKEWEELTKTDFYKAYRYEFCGDCCTLIGKDYGSFSHSCDQRRIRQAYYGPEYEYAIDYRDWARARMRAIIGNALLDRGLEYEHANTIVQRGATVEDLWEILGIEEENE